MVEPSHNLQDLFDSVVDLPPDQRSAYLDAHCHDPELRSRVERFVRRDREQPGRFLESPVSAVLGDSTVATAGTNRQSAQALIGQVLAGRYRLLEIIGEGGMGVVYRSEQEVPIAREVAVKVLKSGLDTARVMSRFEAERQSLARMNHTGIAQVFDAGATEYGRPYFIMELILGQSITLHCETLKLDTHARIELMLGVCDAVQHAHTRGLIHRDLKPENVLVRQDSGQPVIIDFGVAKVMGTSWNDFTAHTEHGQLIGTPEYMSPEQADFLAADADTRTDVYALGAILYHLLTGHPPFDLEPLRRGGFGEIQQVIREIEPQRASERVAPLDPHLASRLRRDLDWILAKALEKDPCRRYQSASELAADLRRHLANETVLARPPSWMYRAHRFTQRNRGLVYGLSTAVIAVLIGLAVTSMLAISESRHRARAEHQTSRAEGVNLFLRHMLGTARELGSNGLDVTMGEVLAATTQQLDAGSLTDQPDVEVEVRMLIAEMYRDLHWPGLAVPHAARAVERIVDDDGATDVQMIEAHLLYGAVLKDTSRLDEAALQFDWAHELAHARLGPDHPVTWVALNQLGNTEYRLGHHGRAKAHLVRALEETRRIEGADSINAAECLFNLAGVHRALGEWEPAAIRYSQAVEVFDANGTASAASAVQARLEMALYVLPALDRKSEAEGLLDQAVNISLRHLGADHGRTASAVLARSRWALRAGEHDGARRDADWFIEHRVRIYGENSVDHAAALSFLGYFELYTGNDEEAIKALRNAVMMLDARSNEAAPGPRDGVDQRVATQAALANLRLAQALLNEGFTIEAANAVRRVGELTRFHAIHADSAGIERERIVLACKLADRDLEGLEVKLRDLLARAMERHGQHSHHAARVRHTLARLLDLVDRQEEAAAEDQRAEPILARAAAMHSWLPPLVRE